MIGVEAGLDSNGRKNRSGKAMEQIIEFFIADLCKKNKLEYLTQANSEKIFNKWKIKIPVDKSSRRYDFVLKKNDELIIFETNFYGGGGSKLKSTAGEYRNLFDVLDNKFKKSDKKIPYQLMFRSFVSKKYCYIFLLYSMVICFPE